MSFADEHNTVLWQARAANDRDHRISLSVFGGNTSIAIFGGGGRVFSNGLSIRSLQQMKIVLLQFAEAGNPEKRTVDLKGKFNPETKQRPIIGSMTIGINEKGLPYIGVSCDRGRWQFIIYPPEPNFMDGEGVSRLDQQKGSIITFFDDIIDRAKQLGVLTNEKRGGGKGGFNKGGSNRSGGYNGGGGGYNRNGNGGGYNGGQQNNNNSGGGFGGGSNASSGGAGAVDDEIPF